MPTHDLLCELARRVDVINHIGVEIEAGMLFVQVLAPPALRDEPA